MQQIAALLVPEFLREEKKGGLYTPSSSNARLRAFLIHAAQLFPLLPTALPILSSISSSNLIRKGRLRFFFLLSSFGTFPAPEINASAAFSVLEIALLDVLLIGFFAITIVYHSYIVTLL
jgi:hypothetical protein